MSYEGYVKYADGSIWSIQCFEGRHDECPDKAGSLRAAVNSYRSDFSIAGPLEGYYCECGCKAHEETK